MLDVIQFPCIPSNANYGYLIRDQATGTVAAIDSPDPDEIERQLDERGWTLDLILNTHHHWDHVDGNPQLKTRYGCTVIGPEYEQRKIKKIDQTVKQGDTVCVGESVATVHYTPGHTLGHIIFHFAEQSLAFVGDTLFSMGCGRLFEGTPQQMWGAMQTLLGLPDDTLIYCAHEYTQANAKFALSVEPSNAALQARAAEVDALRAADKPTVPTTLALEKATNPFLRPDSHEIQASVARVGADLAEVFGAVRRAKDVF